MTANKLSKSRPAIVTIDEAASIAGVSTGRMRQWISQPCDYLGGRKLTVQKQQRSWKFGGGSTAGVRVSMADAETIAMAIAHNQAFIHIATAARQLRLGDQVVRRWCKVSCEWLPKHRQIRSQRVRGMLMVSRDDIQSIADARAVPVTRALIDHNGEKFRSLASAGKLLGLHPATLARQIKQNCWLGRPFRSLEHRPTFHRGTGRAFYIADADVQELQTLIGRGRVGLTIAKVAKRLKIHPIVAGKWCKVACPWLPDRRPIRSEILPCRSPLGRLMPMRVALPEDVQAAAAARRAPPRHESITVGNETYDSAPKAARMLGVTRGFIHSLRRKTLWLGRPIRTAKQSVSYGHTKNPERFFSLSDLREIQKNRAAGHHPPARPALPDFEISHGTDSRTAPAAAIASTANADVPAAKPVALIGTGHVEISEADFKILDALAAKHPRPLLQTDIAEITQLCERTVGKVLKRLRERSLTRRNGKRSGEAITAEGLQQAEKKLPAD